MSLASGRSVNGRRHKRALAGLTAGALALSLSACQYLGASSAPVTIVVTSTSTASSSPAGLPSVFFNSSSPWNTRVETAAVDPNSAKLLAAAGERLGVVEQGGGGNDLALQYRRVKTNIFINTTAWTVPVVSGGVPTQIVCRQTVCGALPRTMQLRVPANANPDPRYDGWITIVDRSHDIAYDLWRARREPDGSISYQFGTTWKLDGSGYSDPGTQSARGSGLPLFAGLITASELKTGLIDHALAISVPGPSQRYFVSPASATDGNGPVDSLPEGARIRLKANVVRKAPVDPTTGKPIRLTADQSRTADAIIAALRTYGAIVVDRAVTPSLYAEKGISTSLLIGGELQGLTLSDFEVVTLGKKYTDAVNAVPQTSTSSATPGAGQ